MASARSGFLLQVEAGLNARDLILVGRFDDPHTDLIQRAHGSVCFLPLGLGPSNYKLFVGPKEASVAFGDVLFDRARVTASDLVFLPLAVNKPALVDTEDQFSLREWSATLESIFCLWNIWNGRGWLISPSAQLLQDRKPYLLCVGDQPELHIPAWRVAVDMPGSEYLAGSHVAKAINSWQEVEPGSYFNTTLLEGFSEEALAAESNTPNLIQQYLRHRKEVRAYVAGDQVIAVELSVPDGAEQADLRIAAGVAARKFVVPVRIADCLRRINLLLDLHYCCFDLVQKDSSWWLLDINPAGTWHFLAKRYNIDVTGNIVRGLIA